MPEDPRRKHPEFSDTVPPRKIMGVEIAPMRNPKERWMTSKQLFGLAAVITALSSATYGGSKIAERNNPSSLEVQMIQEERKKIRDELKNSRISRRLDAIDAANRSIMEKLDAQSEHEQLQDKSIEYAVTLATKLNGGPPNQTWPWAAASFENLPPAGAYVVTSRGVELSQRPLYRTSTPWPISRPR